MGEEVATPKVILVSHSGLSLSILLKHTTTVDLLTSYKVPNDRRSARQFCAIEANTAMTTPNAGSVFPLQLEKSTISPLTRMLVSSEMGPEPPKDHNWRERLDRFIFLTSSRYFLVAFTICVHSLAFSAGLLYYNSNVTPPTADSTLLIARAATLVLHCDAAVLLFPICRTLISILRERPLHAFLRRGNEALFHELIAWSMVFFTLLHTLAHWTNYSGVVKASRQTFIGFLRLNLATGAGWSGNLMLVVLTLIAATSPHWVQTRNWSKFGATHHLYILFFVLWSIHGAFATKVDKPVSLTESATFWQYWVCGGLTYLVERLLREFRGRYKTQISKVIQHPSNVVEIQIKKGNMAVKVGQARMRYKSIVSAANSVTVYLSLLS